jgi:hypothetical protein
VADCNLPEDE